MGNTKTSKMQSLRIQRTKKSAGHLQKTNQPTNSVPNSPTIHGVPRKKVARRLRTIPQLPSRNTIHNKHSQNKRLVTKNIKMTDLSLQQETKKEVQARQQMYIVIREIKGNYYKYEQTSQRKGKKVVTTARYIGKATKKEYEEYKKRTQQKEHKQKTQQETNQK